MQGGDLKDFIDGLYYGYELIFEYKGVKYFIQGWHENDKNYMCLDIPYRESNDYVWEYEAKTMRECAEAFLDEKLWDGKTFYEIEKDVVWSDW